MHDETGGVKLQLFDSPSHGTSVAHQIAIVHEGCLYEGLCLAKSAGGANWDGRNMTTISLAICAESDDASHGATPLCKETVQPALPSSAKRTKSAVARPHAFVPGKPESCLEFERTCSAEGVLLDASRLVCACRMIAPSAHRCTP